MEAIYIYLLKSTMASGCLMGYYWLALRNKRLHQYNRFYLLFSVAVAVLLPLLDMHWLAVEAPQNVAIKQFVAFIDKPMAPPVKAPLFSRENILITCFVGISLLLLSRSILAVIMLDRLKRRSKVISMQDFDFIETSHPNAPFSFFKNLFWRAGISLESTNGKTILKHEMVHMREYHTWDKLIIGLITNIFWMNPFLWILRREMEVIHEFIADEKSIDSADPSVLAALLLETHYPQQFPNTIESYFFSSIKRRISMITHSNKPSYSFLRRICVLPIAGILFLASSFTLKLTKQRSLKEPGTVHAMAVEMMNDTVPQSKIPDNHSANDEYIVKFVGDSAIFIHAKTKKEVYRLPKRQITRPHSTSIIEMEKVDSNVITVQGFPLNKQPTKVVTGFPIKMKTITIKTEDRIVAEKALQIEGVENIKIQKEYGKTIYTIEKLEEDRSEKSISNILYILDGKPITAEEMNAIPSGSIESVNVLKGTTATEKYGSKGANGVIEIRLKK